MRQLKPAIPGSFSSLFNAVGLPAFSLVLRGNAELQQMLGEPRPQRAIGVVYSPHAERFAHYFEARLWPQFDAAVFIATTSALTPLRK